MVDDTASKLSQAEGGGAVGLTYSTSVSVSLSQGKASLYFGNPSKSNQDMVVQLIIQDRLITQSGRLIPGKQVQTLDVS